MKDLSDSLPASELQHFWLNMFNYFRKYTCVHASLIDLEKRTRQQQFPIFFTSSLFIRVTKKFSFNILKTISLKIEKKTCIEAQSESRALVDKTSESHIADWWRRIQKRCCRKREISTTPIQLHLKEVYGECYLLNLAPNQETKAVSYAGKTFRRCAIVSFSKSW